MTYESWDEEKARERAEADARWLTNNMARIPSRYRDADPDQREVGSGLYLFGTVGTGKTHTAAGIMRAHIECLERTRWVNLPAWLNKQRESFDSDEAAETVDYLVNCRLLVLDDIGVERATDWALEMLYVLVSQAYERETPVVVTSNLTLAELADKIGARIVSRLTQMCGPIEMRGPDRRLSA